MANNASFLRLPHGVMYKYRTVWSWMSAQTFVALILLQDRATRYDARTVTIGRSTYRLRRGELVISYAWLAGEVPGMSEKMARSFVANMAELGFLRIKDEGSQGSRMRRIRMTPFWDDLFSQDTGQAKRAWKSLSATEKKVKLALQRQAKSLEKEPVDPWNLHVLPFKPMKRKRGEAEEEGKKGTTGVDGKEEMEGGVFQTTPSSVEREESLSPGETEERGVDDEVPSRRVLGDLVNFFQEQMCPEDRKCLPLNRKERGDLRELVLDLWGVTHGDAESLRDFAVAARSWKDSLEDGQARMNAVYLRNNQPQIEQLRNRRIQAVREGEAREALIVEHRRKGDLDDLQREWRGRQQQRLGEEDTEVHIPTLQRDVEEQIPMPPDASTQQARFTKLARAERVLQLVGLRYDDPWPETLTEEVAR